MPKSAFNKVALQLLIVTVCATFVNLGIDRQ